MGSAGYTVTDTQEKQTITPAGTPRKVYQVWIVTDNGASGMLEVNPADWKTEKLKEIFAAKAAELDLAFTVNRF